MSAAGPVLNLNNEVVRMRADVKKVKALTIRKLIRHVSQLKSRKGPEEQVLKNQRRVQRLLEEMQSIRKLKPDVVTKYALQTEIAFDNVFNKANSTMETRAVTRLATHPLIKKKISAIKDAIKAFKEARMTNTEKGTPPKQPPLPSKPAKSVKQEAQKKPKQEADIRPKQEAQKKPKPGKAKPKVKIQETKLENNVQNNPVVETIDNEKDLAARDPSNEVPCSPVTPQAEALQAIIVVPDKKNMLQSSSGKDAMPTSPEKRIKQRSPAEKVAPTNDSDSSDIEDSDQEDKEYFDDSTEERFIKQPLGFEESASDSEDDFFIGKVRRTKKKKTSKNNDQVKKDKLPPAIAKPPFSGPEEQKARVGPKNVKLESVFCTSLAQAKPKASYMKRESKMPPIRNKKPVFPQANTLSRKPQPVKASNVKQQSKVENETLHPSWEASRKRKEQSQIAVFQGKKIVFDD
ncbi:serum response factor-binding protein 1 isoform X1 [Ranitomeya variabilis]|uniref:serum response factor-binding protein 1 isoform X1 n=2 Tax=Ranitomeya variabilis TaxID=490064 RepID=UPI004055E87B